MLQIKRIKRGDEAQEIRRQKKKIKKLKKLNSFYIDMFGFVAHEFRNCLLNILAWANVLEDETHGHLNEKTMEALQNINKRIETLWDMVQNYLNLAKIEEGKIKLKCEPLDIQKNIIEKVIAEIEPRLAEEQMKVICKSTLPPPQRIISGDIELLRIVFSNLFGNAIKYGRKGTMIICTIEDEVDKLKFSVFNQGQRVPKGNLEKIFQKFIFYTPEKGKVKGLGLYITKWIIKSHGGKIWAESEPEKWFKVIFTLPKGGKNN